MKFSLIMAVTLVISSSAIAEPKLFVCKSIQTFDNETCKPGDVARLQHFLLDTDDFEKESPEYDYQLVYSCVEKNTNFDEVGVLGASTRTIMGYQQKFRYHYDVTPTTLTFHFDLFPTEHKRSHWIQFEMDRETLAAGDNAFCVIEEAPNPMP